MGLGETLQRTFASSSSNMVRSAWDRLSPVPGGSRLFSGLLGRMAPYTGSVGAQVIELRMGWARATLADRRGVRNHLACIHAIALCNLAELTGNVALAYSMPDDARFIVAGLSIDYLKKARGRITGACACPIPETSQRAEYVVEVTMTDEGGDVVARAQLRTLVGPKPVR